MDQKVTAELGIYIRALEAADDPEVYLALLQALIQAAREYERVLRRDLNET